MWRYWELLTDLSLTDIQALKLREPMSVKMELGRRIVSDFHGEAAGRQAEDDFNREVRQGAAPSDIETVEHGAAGDIRVPQMLLALGLAPSRTEAERLVKSGSLEINGVRHAEFVFHAAAETYILRVGKKWKKVTVR